MTSSNEAHPHLVMAGRIRAIVAMKQAAMKELNRLKRVDFTHGWPKGRARRQLTGFRPERVLETLAFVVEPSHELWGDPTVRELARVASLLLEAQPNTEDLLEGMRRLVSGIDRFCEKLQAVVHDLEVTCQMQDRLLSPPLPVSTERPRVPERRTPTMFFGMAPPRGPPS